MDRYRHSMLERLKNLLVARFRHASPAALAATALGLLVTLGAALVFAGISEDVIQHNGAATADPERLAWITHHRSGFLVTGSRVLNDLGSVVLVLAIAVVISAFLWWRRVPIGAAITPLVAVVSAGAFAAGLKLIVDRARPSVAYRLVAEADPSFPSGHATGSTALGVSAAVIVAIYLLRRPLARVAVLTLGAIIPIAVAASRLELGVHWPTDVIAGLALGATVALATIATSLWISTPPESQPTSVAPQHRRAQISAFLRSTRGDSGVTRFNPVPV